MFRYNHEEYHKLPTLEVQCMYYVSKIHYDTHEINDSYRIQLDLYCESLIHSRFRQSAGVRIHYRCVGTWEARDDVGVLSGAVGIGERGGQSHSLTLIHHDRGFILNIQTILFFFHYQLEMSPVCAEGGISISRALFWFAFSFVWLNFFSGGGEGGGGFGGRWMDGWKTYRGRVPTALLHYAALCESELSSGRYANTLPLTVIMVHRNQAFRYRGNAK